MVVDVECVISVKEDAVVGEVKIIIMNSHIV